MGRSQSIHVVSEQMQHCQTWPVMIYKGLNILKIVFTALPDIVVPKHVCLTAVAQAREECRQAVAAVREERNAAVQTLEAQLQRAQDEAGRALSAVQSSTANTEQWKNRLARKLLFRSSCHPAEILL
jgi:hypothetical protein